MPFFKKFLKQQCFQFLRKNKDITSKEVILGIRPMEFLLDE